MGCFLGCFGSEQDRHRKRPKRKSPPRSPIRNRLDNEDLKLLCQLKALPPADSVPLSAENRGKPEPEVVETETETETGSLCVNVKKKVTFDLNVTKYIEATAAVSPILEADEEQGGEDESLKLGEDETVSPKQVAFPENHRYQNCVVSDDEEDEDDDEEVHGGDGFEDLEDDELEDYGGLEEDEEKKPEESQESCFSLSLDAVQMFDVMPEKSKDDRRPELVVSSAGGARDRSQYVRSVLNPVENLSQWKEVKAKPSSTIKKVNKKENIDVEDDLDFPPFSPEEPTFKSPKQYIDVPSTPQPTVAVDASLSTWLSSPSQDTRTSSATVSQPSHSPRRFDDRPILGVLTVEQIKSSASSSPRRSPSKSPDDIPIVGTVGRYWIHQPEIAGMNGIPNTTSKYKEVGIIGEESRQGLRF